MECRHDAKRRQAALIVALIAVFVVLGGWASQAMAVQQVINTPITSPCPFTLVVPAGDDLLITSTGSIRCDGPGAASASNITITVVDGNMEMQAGAKITAENDGGGTAGNISITVNGDFTMRGNGMQGGIDQQCSQVEGACISASSNGGPSKGGNVTITVGNFPSLPPTGTFVMEPGSAVLANSLQGSGGAIVITAGLEMDVDGLVRSFGGITGVGANQPPGGGPITLKSGCALTITPDGVVSSEGRNPGADLVHLEGCTVTVNGVVRSIAQGNGGHAIPNNPANHCNADPATHTPAFTYTACVEIWGQTVVINSVTPNKGEVYADGVTDSGLNTRAWVDIFAANNITINNDATGPYSVHSNAGPTEGDFGGLITIKSRDGAFSSSGLAIQANAVLGNSGHGGTVIVEAANNVDFGTSVVQANGSAVGSNRTGGSISARSFNGQVTGTMPGSLTATAGTVAGTITLQGCGTGAPGDGVTYSGTTNPPATILADACGGNPDLPAAVDAELAVLAPICSSPECGGNVDRCVKRGRKFNDIAGQPGLAGWQICAYNDQNVLESCQTTTAPNGAYEFDQLTCGLQYTFCEVLQPNWTQTFPTLPNADPTIVSCQGLVSPGPGPLGPVGYRETLVVNVPSENNDFGNVTTGGGGQCPKFPTLNADVTITIDPNNASQIQDAINALGIGKTLLILPLNGTKNEIISINKNVKVVGCSITLNGQNSSSVVVTIGSGAAGGSTTDVHATGGTVAGYKLEGNNHTVKNVRATNNAIGFWVTGNANLITGAQGTTGNGIGFKIDGDGNTVDTASAVTNNTSHGAQITSGGSGNTIKKSTFSGNGGEGILVEGPSNIVSENKVYSSVLNGIRVTGTGNQVLKNQTGDKGKGNGLDGILISGNNGPVSENVSRSNGKNGFEIASSGHTLTKNTAGGDAQQNNAACEFTIAANNVNGGSNKANGNTFSFTNAGVACQE